MNEQTNEWSRDAWLVGQGHHCVRTVQTPAETHSTPTPPGGALRGSQAHQGQMGARGASSAHLGLLRPLCSSHRKERSSALRVWGMLSHKMLSRSSPTLQGSVCLSLPSPKEGAWGAGPSVPMRTFLEIISAASAGPLK